MNLDSLSPKLYFIHLILRRRELDHVSISILAKLTIKVESKVLILSAVSAAYRSATYYELFYSQLV